jgi:histidinol-phosphatase
VETKPDLTPVSDADRAVERMIRERLAAERPDDLVIGEEYGGAAGSAEREWIIDPIDGTKNFVRGAPVWATLIALRAADEVVVGVVSAPALGRRWWASRGAGAWTATASATDERQCRVSSVGTMSDAFLAYGDVRSWARHGRGEQFLGLANAVWRTRGFGDFWAHVLVAEGAVDLSCEPELSLWDLAALQPIVEEAGGRFTDLSGVARPDGGSVLCTNGLLHDAALAAFGQHGD